MYDWIIEADIMRLEKQLRGENLTDERQRLSALIDLKRMQLRRAMSEFIPGPDRKPRLSNRWR